LISSLCLRETKPVVLSSGLTNFRAVAIGRLLHQGHCEMLYTARVSARETDAIFRQELKSSMGFPARVGEKL
jgi:hypothetical protein